MAQIAVPVPELGPGQLVQVVPQAVGFVSPLHALPHWWKPELQVILQVPVSQLFTPLAGSVQTVVQPPQWLLSVLKL